MSMPDRNGDWMLRTSADEDAPPTHGIQKGVQLVGRIKPGRIRQRNLLDYAATRFEFPDNLKLFTEPVVFDGRKRQQRLTVPEPVQSLRGQSAGHNLIHDPIARSDADQLALFGRCYECRRDDSNLQILPDHLLTANCHQHTMIGTIRQSAGESKMQFGERVRELRQSKDQPDAVVGSSRGGAVAINIESGNTPLVLLCLGSKKWGSATTVKENTTILHSRADDVVPFADSEELVAESGLHDEALIEIGNDHRLADPEPLAKMLEACENKGMTP